MPNEFLTTVDDPQVNSEEQESFNEEVTEVQEVEESTNVDESISNEQAETEAYKDAWDNTNLDDDSVFDNLFNGNTNDEEVPAAPDLLSEETTQDTNNNIGAFMVDKPVLKYKGKEVPIDNEAELIALAQKGFSYETEMANIKPQKKVINIVDGIPLDVLQAVADIHKGNKEAISFIKSQYGIEDVQSTRENTSFWGDESDVETKQEKPAYTPEVKQESPLEEFWAAYSNQNQSAASKASDVYGELDDSFKREVYQPNVFQAFVQSVETGEFESAYPLAIKEKSLNPAMTWLQAYGVAVSKLGQAPSKQAEPPKSATPPARANAPRNVSDTAKADMVWNDDSYFQELENKLFG